MQANKISTPRDELQKLISSNRVANARFGFHVAIENNFVVIGATGENRDATGGNSIDGAIAVYVFKFG